MLLRQHDDHLLGLDHFPAQVRLVGEVAVEAHGDAPFAKSLDLPEAVEAVQHQFHLRMAETKALHDPRDRAEHRRAEHADVEPPEPSVAGHARALGGLLGESQQVARLGVEHLACGRRFGAACAALEQLHAERFLELVDLSRQRRLRDVQPQRRRTERALLDHRHEVAQVAQFDAGDRHI